MEQEEIFDDLAERIQKMQDNAWELAQKKNPAATLKRGFHAKGTGVRARFEVKSDLPENLHIGLFQPGAVHEALVRFSNARGEVYSDLAKDQRGIAIRIKTKPGENLAPDDTTNIQDFLMTNTPVSFARNPTQFIEVGEILQGGVSRVLPRLVKKYGFKEARRIMGVFLAPVISFKPLQMNHYWSRTSYQYGEHAIRYLIRPSSGSRTWSTGRQLAEVLRSIFRDRVYREHYLHGKLQDALREGEACFDFCIQLFVDEKKTPIEDAYIEWKETDSPPIVVATLILPQQEPDAQLADEIEKMAFNPWNTHELHPLGLINLARKKVYGASAGHRASRVDTRHP
jgi:catalase